MATVKVLLCNAQPETGTTTYNSGECKDKVDVKFIIIIQIWENSFDI